MKNLTLNEVKGLTIPKECLDEVGFNDKIKMESLNNVIVLTKNGRTVLEMINTIEGLEEVVSNLYNELIARFPTSEDECESCEFCELDVDEDVHVPDWAMGEAGIKLGTKLDIFVEEDSGQIILAPADCQHDISDVSEEMIETLSDMGVCLGELNESIMLEVIIYEG